MKDHEFMTQSTPLAYRSGLEAARAHHPRVAEKYVRHTTIGDPVLDSIMLELSDLPPEDLHRFVAAGIEGHAGVLREAPGLLRNFFDDVREPPWLDHDAFTPGIRAFRMNASLFLTTFVCGVLVEGFVTLISKSFSMTERLAHTHRRLQQNNRQLLEVFQPGGLQRYGDGWKLSARVRFVHARVRHLLARSDGWDAQTWGKPISAAHLGYAIAVFSMRLLAYADKVGASLSEEEKDSIVAVWRYVGHVMGIPETILYADGKEASSLHGVVRLCEPPPDADSIAMANALIRTAPKVAGITDPREQRSVERLAYRISRALIGNTLADALQYPKLRSFGELHRYRMVQRVNRLLKRDSEIVSENLSLLKGLSAYDESGLSYRMPDHAKHLLSSEW